MINRYQAIQFRGRASTCWPCMQRAQCLRKPDKTEARQVSFFAQREVDLSQVTDRMKPAIDPVRGRMLYSRRIGTVAPVFANLRHHKRLNGFTLRGQAKVNTQWHLECLAHHIEKMATARC